MLSPMRAFLEKLKFPHMVKPALAFGGVKKLKKFLNGLDPSSSARAIKLSNRK